MFTRPLLILAAASLLAGCVYAGPPGPYAYSGYPARYQTTYQPAYTSYQPAPAYTYRTAPAAYPLYSPSFPYGDGGNGS